MDVALLRLAAQGLLGPGAATPGEAVRSLLAVQAQDLPAAATAVAVRCAARDAGAVRDALDDGSLVRTWPMRGTLHLLAARDAAWLTALAAPRVVSGTAGRRRQLGLADTDLARAGDLAQEALAGGARLRRAELFAVWDAGGVATGGQRGVHLLGHLAMTGLLVLGPTRGGEQLVVLARDHLPPAPQLPREAALAELADRYYRGHGPASVADLARWARLPSGEARAATAAVRGGLLALADGDRELLCDPAVPDRLAAAGERAAGLLLLPAFDELVLGYADRSATLDRAQEALVVPGDNGIFRPTAVLGGRAVGTWARTGRDRAGVAVEPFPALEPAAAEALLAAAPAAARALPAPAVPPLRR